MIQPENIPMELRMLPQWVVSGPDKVPVNPRTGRAADPCNPADWVTFEEAMRSGLPNPGFCLSESDPFVFIDLDNPFARKDKTVIREQDEDYPKAVEDAARAQAILDSFDTYAELSQSGTGVHIIAKGRIPRGTRRDKVEIYGSMRYMICTGHVIKNLPVKDCQNDITALWLQCGRMITPEKELIEEDPTDTDTVLWQRGRNASQGAKFVALCEGRWQELGYQSQSEADYGLLSMLCFYTHSNAQVRRMFRQTVLGQREKAQKNDTYIDRSMRRIRANEVPEIDLSAITYIPQDDKETVTPEVVLAPLDSSAISLPPGLVGKVADYVYRSAVRQVPEVALAAAIALCAGIAGRAYNISGTGLNQYVILIGTTGIGKESAGNGMDLLCQAASAQVPMVSMYRGPSNFSSGPAIYRCLDKQPCFMAALGEIGLTMQGWCSPSANETKRDIRRVLLDVYSKSGFSNVLRENAYSDTAKNTGVIQAPALTMLGDATPESFYQGLTVSHIAEGLIPRFLVIESEALRMHRNPNAFCLPPQDLVDEFAQFVSVAVATQQHNTVCPVRVDTLAQAMLDGFDREATDRINHAAGDVVKQLWNRAHLKALKLAALIAAGCAPHAPVITQEIALWAIALVRRDIDSTERRFIAGEIGNGEDRQEAEIRRLCKSFWKFESERKRKYRLPEPLHNSGCVPFQYLNIYTRSLAPFREDRRGASEALRRALVSMEKQEILEQIPEELAKVSYNTRAPIFYPGQGW